MKDRVEFEYGYSVRVNNEKSGAYPVFGSNGITGYIDSYKVEGPGIIIGRKGSVGAVKYSKDNFTPTDTAYYLSIKDKTKDDIKFWYYYLQLLGLEKLNTHSSVPGLSREIAYFINVNPPDLPTQQKIAAVLSALDAKIELNARINAELESMAKTLYDYWFVQFAPHKSAGGKMVWNETLKREIPLGWEVDVLGNHIKINRGISYTSADLRDSGIPMINLNSVYLDGSYKKEGIKFLADTYKDSKEVKNGDLLLAVTDVTRNAFIIGKSFILPDLFSGKVVASSDIAQIDVDDKLDKYFLNMLFNSDSYHNYIKGFASGTLVLHLNVKGIEWYKILIPPKDLLNKFSEIKRNIEHKKSLVIKESQTLTELRDWLLPMLMNGQVKIKT